MHSIHLPHCFSSHDSSMIQLFCNKSERTFRSNYVNCPANFLTSLFQITTMALMGQIINSSKATWNSIAFESGPPNQPYPKMGDAAINLPITVGRFQASPDLVTVWDDA